MHSVCADQLLLSQDLKSSTRLLRSKHELKRNRQRVLENRDVIWDREYFHRLWRERELVRRQKLSI